MIEAAHWQDIEAQGTWPGRFFRARELADRLTGALRIDPHFLAWLEEVRKEYGRVMVINSGYRTPEHQEKLTGRRTGAHVDGVAVDVRVAGRDAYDLLQKAMDYGVSGIGINQTGEWSQRYLHLDLWTGKGRPAIWSY